MSSLHASVKDEVVVNVIKLPHKEDDDGHSAWQEKNSQYSKEVAQKMGNAAQIMFSLSEDYSVPLHDRFNLVRLGYEMKIINKKRQKPDYKVEVIPSASQIYPPPSSTTPHSAFSEFGVHKAMSPLSRGVVRSVNKNGSPTANSGNSPTPFDPMTCSPDFSRFGAKFSAKDRYSFGAVEKKYTKKVSGDIFDDAVAPDIV
ncbi:unnamed protein product [Caenorhabditis auriculariae]|uniref:Uncharacterized protein n=1 Tax=Caenorhabditis auriculariae TaxID=2777116 RepID=A0A8S1H7L1_9PELO|nr:unnamed protein product [Caenorhabditis auriculariae]